MCDQSPCPEPDVKLRASSRWAKFVPHDNNQVLKMKVHSARTLNFEADCRRWEFSVARDSNHWSKVK